MRKFFNHILVLTIGIYFFNFQSISHAQTSTIYYLNSVLGNDNLNGQTPNTAWKTIAKLQSTKLNPGDSVRFSRGSSFDQLYIINDSGNENKPIVLTDYGDSQFSAPAFTNKTFKQNNFGNCIRIKGSYIIVENLFFHETPTYVGGNYTTDGGWAIWEMGTVYIDKGATNCIIRNNEFNDCPVGIKSYGEHTLITQNYLHDCNRVLAEWNWGPIGIWFGADYQEASYNRIFNYRAEDPRIKWAGDTGGGADGGAFEVDDARYPKSNINIHHNYTRDCQGFIEVTWTDVLQNPDYVGFQIHHNIADDYQAFTAVWRGRGFRIENNTIVRRKMNSNDWGVFNITGMDTKNYIRNNIIITEKNIPIFNTGINNVTKPNNIIENNLYYAASGTINLGKEGPGTAFVHTNPLLANYARLQYPEDFALTIGSPAIDKGQNLGYTLDFDNNQIPAGVLPDIGAFEYRLVSSTPLSKDILSKISRFQDVLIIDNLDNYRHISIYNLMGVLMKKIDIDSGKNYIPLQKEQIYLVSLGHNFNRLIY